jgi:hypothetical protein
MPAGGPGDEPVLDILRWRRPVYSVVVDSLIAELAELWDGTSLEAFLSTQRILWMRRTPDDLAHAEIVLAKKRDELYEDARVRGWDMEDLDTRIEAQQKAVAEAWSGNDAR